MDVPILKPGKIDVVIELVFEANSTKPTFKLKSPSPDPNGIHFEGDKLVLDGRSEWMHIRFKIKDNGRGRNITFPTKSAGAITYSDDAKLPPKPWRKGESHQFPDVVATGSSLFFCYTNDPENVESYYGVTYFIDGVPHTPDPRIKNGFSLAPDGGGMASAVQKPECESN